MRLFAGLSFNESAYGGQNFVGAALVHNVERMQRLII